VIAAIDLKLHADVAQVELDRAGAGLVAGSAAAGLATLRPARLFAADAAAALKSMTGDVIPISRAEHLARIDKALALIQPAHDTLRHRGTPASLETRFVAANTFLGMPAMFNRRARGAKLLADVLASPQFSTSPLPFRGTVWLRAGDAAAADDRPADARRWFEQVVASGAPQAAVAQTRLKELAS